MKRFPDNQVTAGVLGRSFGPASLHPSKSKPSVVSIRLSAAERERLEELAAGITLSAYIRACVFAEETKRRKTRHKSAIEDRKAAAEALALLGQSRIANNLNQLAHHANIGALIIDDEEKAQIAEATAHLAAIRALLMQALGKAQKGAL